MAGSAYSFDAVGAEAMLRRLGVLATALTDPDDLLGEMGRSLLTSVFDRFERGEAPDGAPWAPSRRADEDGGQTLVDRGHLRDSVTFEVEGGALYVGTNLVYGAIHQFGGEIVARNAPFLAFRDGDGWARAKSVTIPARPYLGLSPGDEHELERIAQDHIARLLGVRA